MRKIGLGLFVLFVAGCGAVSKSESRSPGAPAGYPAAEAAASPASPMSGDGARVEAIAATSPSPAPAAAGAPAKASADKSAELRAAPDDAAIGLARPRPEPRPPQAGQLTAGVWDDNVNYDFFRPYQARFVQNQGRDFAMFSEREVAAARELATAQPSPRTDLDVQLVLDTTGSMGDELRYLQGEFDGIAAQVRTKFPNVTPRFSLVVYRDKGDEYVTRQFDFTTDTSRFRRDLRAQSAGGGGDTPEAVVQGLSAGLRQGWRTQDSVAKIAFWVADAPAHPGEGTDLALVIRQARAKGVHIYPVASSDTDDAAEYQMRSAAQMTGGRYLFLTNDSGIGNDHAEPHIPCYNVTRLDSAIVRMIQVELTGRHVEPEQREIVRSVGRPNKDGKCQTSSGMLVASF